MTDQVGHAGARDDGGFDLSGLGDDDDDDEGSAVEGTFLKLHT